MPVTFEVLTIPVMIAETISLRILAFPKVLATLGLLPGIAVIIGVGVLTTYTGLVIGDFKCRYPQAHSMADAGTILWGRIGCEILGAAQLIFFVFIMGSHILTFSVMMSVLTGYSGCTVLFSVAGGLPSNVFTIPRRLESLSFLSSPYSNIITAYVSQSIISIANIVFAYAGHVAFFAFFSELRGVRDYPRALALLQVSEVTLYMVTAIVIHVLAGNDVASPSLNSVSPIFKKISYGIAIPTQECHALTSPWCNISMGRCMRDSMVFGLGSFGKHAGIQRYLGPCTGLFQSSRRVLALPQCTWEASKLEADNSDRLQLHHCHHRGSYVYIWGYTHLSDQLKAISVRVSFEGGSPVQLGQKLDFFSGYVTYSACASTTGIVNNQ
ncbi:hypothetical protein BDQ94DRAFT_186454 [Aspergillus welwitschiae]|uniref:Amino acid transporter transmembrane domain-containing protein n=1 Tax=Aspergillus welwitschiae TaxID=1341132 RepID=A0A3F3PID2_9EURO|nr:hypothetical protein BDQ94DRAFT_186454 [Aspergillus welwitschiae]RDH26678.1 hypothetical protein BDQ94DRAFT_186454 [Aspergillus welwitschiae]